MNVEQMLKFLGVRTQSKESIDLCFQMDLEAFNMMSASEDDFKTEKYQYECVYRYLLDTLGYEALDVDTKLEYQKVTFEINLDEDDKEYRDLYFTGLERVLLRFDRYDLVGFQRLAASDHDGIAKDAYLYELRGDYDKAIKYYNLIGETDRVEICNKKQEI